MRAYLGVSSGRTQRRASGHYHGDEKYKFKFKSIFIFPTVGIEPITVYIHTFVPPRYD